MKPASLKMRLTGKMPCDGHWQRTRCVPLGGRAESPPRLETTYMTRPTAYTRLAAHPAQRRRLSNSLEAGFSTVPAAETLVIWRSRHPNIEVADGMLHVVGSAPVSSPRRAGSCLDILLVIAVALHAVTAWKGSSGCCLGRWSTTGQRSRVVAVHMYLNGKDNAAHWTLSHARPAQARKGRCMPSVWCIKN